MQSQRAAGLVVIKCAGSIVAGSEVSILQDVVDSAMAEGPYVILDLAGIDFLDSSGLGLLLRLRNRARLAGGDLRIAAPPPRIKEILRITRLETIFAPHTSAEEAIAATYDNARSTPSLGRLMTDILCVAESHDVLAYVCEIVRQSGFTVLSSDNLPDALMLLRAVRPKAVVMSAALRSVPTSVAESFNKLADARAVVELPDDFSQADAGEATERLLGMVRSVIR